MLKGLHAFSDIIIATIHKVRNPFRILRLLFFTIILYEIHAFYFQFLIRFGLHEIYIQFVLWRYRPTMVKRRCPSEFGGHGVFGGPPGGVLVLKSSVLRGKMVALGLSDQVLVLLCQVCEISLLELGLCIYVGSRLSIVVVVVEGLQVYLLPNRFRPGTERLFLAPFGDHWELDLKRALSRKLIVKNI